MPEALVCPNCGTEVQYRDAVGPNLECPRCHTPLASQRAGQVSGTSAVSNDVRQRIEQTAHGAGHVGPLNKIQAIKYYREATGASLADAKRAVEANESQLGLHVSGPATSGSSARFVGVLVFAGILAAVVGGIFALVQSRSASTPILPNNVPPIALPAMPSIPKGLLPSTSPQFANKVMEFGSQGTGPSHFDDARSIAVDNDGHVYVGEYSNGHVQVFDTNGKYLSEFSLGPRSYLQNLIADRKGTVYAVTNSHILRFKGATGEAQGEMDRDSENGNPKDYSDACMAPGGGAMYAISSSPGGEAEIVKLDTASGKIVSSFDTKKSVGESLDFFRIAATTTGEIYALDREKGVFKFTADGRYVNRFGGGKSAGVSPMNMPPSQLFSPMNLAIDGQGRLYVSDAISCIKVYDKDGNYLDTFGGHEVCFGMAIDDQDNIYAALRNRHTVGKFVLAKR